jgi:glutaminyl-tRNA synthetase
LYNSLFTKENPNEAEEGQDFTAYLNPNSVEVLNDCKLEPALAALPPGSNCQFERLGYFCMDAKNASPESPVFNRTVTLRDTWAKILKAQRKSVK